MRIGFLYLLLAAASTTPAARADVIFTFDDVASGTTTPFSQTKSGLTATFFSPNDPGGFQVSSILKFASPMTGNTLFDNGANSNIPLIVTFSQNVASVSLDFAVSGSTSDVFKLEAFEGGINGSPRGTSVALGVIPSGFTSPQGSIAFSGALFDTIKLTSDSSFFAIKNLELSTVPEPSSLALGLGMCIVGIQGVGWRGRRFSKALRERKAG